MAITHSYVLIVRVRNIEFYDTVSAKLPVMDSAVHHRVHS